MFFCLLALISAISYADRLIPQNDQEVWNLSEKCSFLCDSNCSSSINLTGTSQDNTLITISGNGESNITL